MTRTLLLRPIALFAVLCAAFQPTHARAQTTSLTISGTPATTVTAGATYKFTPAASGGRSTRRFFLVRNRPTWASFDWRSGTLSGTPTSSQVGTYSSIRISVSDGRSSASLPAFAITVAANTSTGTTTPPTTTTTNRAPVISGTPQPSVVAGTAYAFQPSASDPDGDALTFTIQSKPTWASFSPSNGRLSGTPAATDVGTTSGITIFASDGKTVSALPSFSIQVTAASTTIVNNPPTISGTPPTAIVVGQTYVFQPTGSDPDGDVIAYGISNKPTWATFSTTTGRLAGVPTAADVGTTSNIVIAVSDSKANATLPAFSVNVTQSANGSVTLNWTAPTTNTDGTPLIDLAGYTIQYGTSATALTQSVRVTNPGITSYVVSNLSPGTWYFALSAFNAAGTSSAPTSPTTGKVL